MATILKIKRSSTNPTATPGGLGQGELAYGEGTSTYTDAQGASVTSYGKLFVGKGTETNGIAANLDIIGGKYFTDLLDHGHGTITANSAAIVDSANKVDVWNVDNITLNGNTISTTNSNGDLTIDTDGTGDVILSGTSTVGDNRFIINDGSTNRFVVDSFSGAVDISTPALSSADTLINVSSTWNNATAVFYGIDLDVTNTASSANSRLLNLSVGGSDKFNVDVDGNVYLTGNISYANAVNFNIQDDTSDSFVVQEGSNKYIDIDTNNDAELLTLGNSITSINSIIEDNVADAFVVQEGSNQYIAIDTTDSSELITFSTGDVDIDNDLNVDGGDLTTNQTTFNLLNTNATTVNAFGAATTLVIGNASGNFNVDSTGNTDLGGDLNIDGDDITTSQITFNLLNATSTTVNAFGAATSIDIGAATGTTSINNNLDVDLDLNVDGGDITTNQTTFNLLNTNATTVNAFGSATTIEIGAATGTTNINNDLDVDGDVNIDGGDLTVSTTTFNLANTNATTLNIGGAATTVEIGATTGTTSINNNLDVDGDVNVDGGDITTNQTTFNVINTNATEVNAFGAATTINMGTANTTLDLGNIRIFGNTISTDSNAATELIIDPFPDAGDAGGDVIIRGNLQVAGTTTTVNSTEMSVNDPVFTIGDTVTEKTVTTTASSGATDLLVDNPSGVVEGATITGTGIANNTTISNVRIAFNVGGALGTTPSVGDNIYFYDGTSFSLLGNYVSEASGELVIDLASNISTRGDDFYNGNQLTTDSSGTPSNTASITKVDTKVFKTTTLTISNGTTTSVGAETKLTISQASDDNLDRGIQFKYLDTNNSKVGFFGYDDSTRYFTFIPDATNNSNLFSGTKGEAWFKTVKLDDGVEKGVPYFTSDKELTTTVAAGTSDITTSHKILTSNGASGEPIWTTTIDGGTY